MRKTSASLTMLAACLAITQFTVADDSAPQKKPAKSKWVLAMEKTFENLDKDKNKVLSFDEYKGNRRKPESIEKAEQIFKLIDKDNDKKVSLSEFTNKPAEARFKLMDRNNDGGITFDAYKGKREKPAEVEVAERRFKRMDSDGDKKLTVKELIAEQKKQKKKPTKKRPQPKRLKGADKK